MKIKNKGCENTDAVHQKLFNSIHSLDPRTTDTQREFFFRKSQTSGLGQTNWAKIFLRIRGIFGEFISTNFGTVRSLSMFSINQSLVLKKTKPLYPNSQKFIWECKLNLARKELGI